MKSIRLRLVLAIVASPTLALAHGIEALVVGLCLPSLVVPGVLALSLLVWRGDRVTKMLSAAAVVGTSAAMVGFNYVLVMSRWQPPAADLLWWGGPIVVSAAAWVACVGWRRHERHQPPLAADQGDGK